MAALVSARLDAATISAASCSSSDVQAAVNSARTGDAVLVPAGNCIYTTPVDIPTGKNLVIQGAGIGVTTISRTGLVFILNQSSSRITGFTFANGIVSMRGSDWRIDHNRFTESSDRNDNVVIECEGPSSSAGRHCRGLIDHNEFVGGSRVVVAGFPDMAEQNLAWRLPTAIGSRYAVFIEDNTFTKEGAAHEPVDTNYGGQYVFRFNSVTNETIHVHSLQQFRGSRAWEIYGNVLHGTEGLSWTPVWARGGTGVVWANTVTGSWSSGPAFLLDNVRSLEARDYGACDGSSTADGNAAGMAGWPCRDQIGRGQDSCLSDPSSDLSSATEWCSQASEPVFFWLNRTPGNEIMPVQIQNEVHGHIVANRDYYNEAASFNGTAGVGSGPLANRPATCTSGAGYWAIDQGEWNSLNPGPDGQLYKCTATNTWSLYYTPYQYPHPAQNASALSAPTAPTNLRIVR